MAGAEPIEFNRDIRPILSDRCFTCHGPDSKNRLTKLRFDTEAGAKQDLNGRRAVVAGDPATSEMYRRITASKPGLRMPPASSGPPLTEAQVGKILRWIEQGAKWQQHWAWIPARRPPPPDVRDPAWRRNPIDAFVLQRLESKGLAHSAEADRERLIRRVTLDLTGAPPTPAEIDAFLNDTSSDAYERVVDRLLASTRYGERMAERWLDGARYADSHGYQTDGERYMWRWRDWVIDSFNHNQPFDSFTVEQIGGDLIPNATLEQKIASGFNRNHRANGEGGIVPEEYRIEYVVDRVDTTATVWQGLTLGCARCHDHKYDPFAQKEFYQLFAYFNNVQEKGRVRKVGNSEPSIPAPTREQQPMLIDLERKLGDAARRFAGLEPELAAAQNAWERSFGSKQVDWVFPRGLAARYTLAMDSADLLPRNKEGQAITTQWREGEAQLAPGRQRQVASFDGRRFLDCGAAVPFASDDKFTFSAWIHPAAPTGGILTSAYDAGERDGVGKYLQGGGLYLKEGKVQVNLVSRWQDNALSVETEQPIDLNRWHHVLATYDGSRIGDHVKIYVDGRPATVTVPVDELTSGFKGKEPLRIGAGMGPANRFRGLIEDVRVHNVVLTPEEAAVVATPGAIGEIVALAPEKRSPAQANKLRLYFLEAHAPAHLAQAWRDLSAIRQEHERFVDGLPTVMVMEEMATPREARVLIRGAYDRPGAVVTPGVPAALPPLPAGVPNNRLGLARWLVDPSNPLTSRVIVNRFWEIYFGTGLVKTTEDFGSQGEWPSHPELLDWLATEFVRTGWNVKAMQRLIVTSATYRQSSKVTPELLQQDPENRLLARGPRFRLTAEMIRDQALYIAGLMVDRVGGPSVKPYQPDGLWKELLSNDYPQDHGESLYRRSLYTFWRRTAPPPSMMTFDAAGRETCVVRRSRTNTPLQALDLMNDVSFLEAARALGERMIKEGGKRPEERIAFAFRLATARRPAPRETDVLVNSFRFYHDKFLTDRKAAVEYLKHGERARDESLDASEAAAYAAIASLILNLDETVTKG